VGSVGRLVEAFDLDGESEVLVAVELLVGQLEPFVGWHFQELHLVIESIGVSVRTEGGIDVESGSVRADRDLPLRGGVASIFEDIVSPGMAFGDFVMRAPAGHGFIGAVSTPEDLSVSGLLALACAVRGALALVRAVAIVHVRAHFADNTARRRMAVELVVLDEVVKEGLGGVVVVVRGEMARFRQGSQREATESSVVASDCLRLGLAIIVVINFSVLLPELCTDIEKLLHPNCLTSCSISEIKFSGGHEQRVVLLQHVVIERGVVDKVLGSV